MATNQSGGRSAGSWMGKLYGSATEAKEVAAFDKARRSVAQNILNPKEVVGEYDAGRVLMTTLGGEVRPISADDLAVFRQNIRTVQRHFKGGIRARQVLDMSLPVDRERAQREIRMAVPASASNGRVRFVTNAGPDSNVSRHHVAVEFMSYGAAASAGAKNPKQAASWLRKQPLKFDCDCGRHTYWFRYISTIGSFNAGRAETGFPKIRNPNLHGVGCKHVLRVMAEIESSGTVLLFLTRLLERARNSDENKAVLRQTQKEAEEAAKKGRVRDIKTTEDRRKAAAIARERRAVLASSSKAPKPKKPTAATRRAKPASAGFNAAQIALFKSMGLSDEQIALAAAAGSK